jgi:hypothetical protein
MRAASYGILTAERGLKATRDEYKTLKGALEAADEENEFRGFEVEYYDDEVHVFAPEDGDWEALPRAFLSLLGTLIVKNGLKYLEFSGAFTCEWSTMGSRGGTCFRITSKGSIWKPTLTW